jgi:hypothetical protein
VGKSKILATLLGEIAALSFRLKIIKFSAAEMAY